jgi:hypothetical protein
LVTKATAKAARMGGDATNGPSTVRPSSGSLWMLTDPTRCTWHDESTLDGASWSLIEEYATDVDA